MAYRTRQQWNAWAKTPSGRASRRASAQKRNELLKLEALFAYGGPVCCKCGFGDVRALQLDHIAGNGSIERRKGLYNETYAGLKRRGFPSGYQVLCANCNWIKRHENNEFNRAGRAGY